MNGLLTIKDEINNIKYQVENSYYLLFIIIIQINMKIILNIYTFLHFKKLIIEIKL